MGLERHGRVRGYGFGPTPTSIFGSTSRRWSGVILSTQIENAQEILIAAEQKFTTAIEELSNVKETFEERLIEVQRKTREEMKEEFEEKMMEMQRKMQAQMQAQIQEQMMQMMQQFQQK